MNKIIALLSCALLIATVSNAQDSIYKKTKKERIQNMDSTHKQNLKEKGLTKENLKELDLTKEQQKQVEEIHTNAKKEKDKINSDASLTPVQKEEKIKLIEKDSKNKLGGVLTQEQKDKIKKKRSKPQE